MPKVGSSDPASGQVALAWLLARYDRLVPIPVPRRATGYQKTPVPRASAVAADPAELRAVPAPVGAGSRAWHRPGRASPTGRRP